MDEEEKVRARSAPMQTPMMIATGVGMRRATPKRVLLGCIMAAGCENTWYEIECAEEVRRRKTDPVERCWCL